MTDKKMPLGTLRGPQVLVLYLLGLIAIYVGERLVGGNDAGRWLTSACGAAAVLASLLLWLRAALRGQAEVRKAEKISVWLSLGTLASLIIYLLSSDLFFGAEQLAKTSDAGVGLRDALQVAWPIALFCTSLPLIFVHISAASMGGGSGVEGRRLKWSASSGAAIAMLLCTLFLLNAAGNRWDKSVDMSYFKTTTPGEATRSLVSGLTQDTEVLLFFPPANDVLVEIEPYFKQLASLSPRFTYRVLDRVLEPELTRKHRIASDGTVLVVRGEATERISIGDDLDRAKRTLRKFDEEFLKVMMKMSRKRETVYIIVGHGERPTEYVADEVRPRLSVLKKFLEALNLQVKNFGPVEGLARGVPSDAGLVLWLDPAGQLFPGESEALRQYLENGGRMLITLDVDHQGAADELLKWLGLKYQPVKLAHDKAFVIADNAPSDIYNLVTTSFSAHPSVTTVSRASQYFPVLFPASGYLERLAGAESKPPKTLVFNVRSLTETWADANGDTVHGKEETGRIYELAAAVSWKSKSEDTAPSAASLDGGTAEGGKAQAGADGGVPDGGTPDGGQGEKTEKEQTKPSEIQPAESRVVVLADTDWLADRYIGFRVGYSEVGGNLQLLADLLRWLLDEERVPGVAASEEDVKVVHTRAQDKIWFYGTVFAVPALILAVGAVTRWGRGWRRRFQG